MLCSSRVGHGDSNWRAASAGFTASEETAGAAGGCGWREPSVARPDPAPALQRVLTYSLAGCPPLQLLLLEAQPRLQAHSGPQCWGHRGQRTGVMGDMQPCPELLWEGAEPGGGGRCSGAQGGAGCQGGTHSSAGFLLQGVDYRSPALGGNTPVWTSLYGISVSLEKDRSSPTLGAGLGEQIWGWVLASLCKIQTAQRYVEALS